MDKTNYKILVVDNDEQILESVRNLLSRHGYFVETVMSGYEAIEKVNSDPFAYALVILDYDLPGINGGETARKLVEINQSIFIVIFSGIINVTLKAQNIELLRKGGKFEELLAVVEGWCRKFEATNMVAREPESLEANEAFIRSFSIHGRSQALVDILRKILKYEESKSDTNVLIRGESGTGKERIARIVHDHSLRKDGPYIAENLASISSEQIESKLFGHIKGSFTGATSDREGLLKKAEGGTLFLDEIGELPLDLQVKLLRVIQEKVYTPVGSDTPVKANVRFITATNRDLESAIKERIFREDLYYRLNGTTIQIPPLRERKRDIEPLIIATCERFNKTRGTRKVFLKSAVALLERLPWRGNVRELQSVVEHYLTECESNRISPDDLGRDHFDVPSNLRTEYQQLNDRQKQDLRTFFASVLERCRSQKHAASELDIPQTTLIGILERLELPTDFKKSISLVSSKNSSGAR